MRLLSLLDAADSAGLVPVPIVRLHAFAYLANVLAPVWDIRAMDGKILKRRGGPFYPALQRDLDHLVAAGMVRLSSLGYEEDEDGRWRLDAAYELNRDLAANAVDYVRQHNVEGHGRVFLQELAYALSALSEEDLDAVVGEDATYSDDLVTEGNVVDFAEWRDTNYSANAATYFERVMPGGAFPTPGEKLHLYVRHLYRRMHGAR